MGLYTGCRKQEIVQFETQLHPVTGRPSLHVYLKQLYGWRHFMRAEARAKAYSNAREMLLGRIWLLLAPLLDVGVYGLIFGVVLKTSRGVDHFIPFLITGIVFFSFSLKHLNGGCGLIQARKAFVKSFAFPKAALVFSHSLRFFYDSIPVVMMAFVAIVIFPQAVEPSFTWIIFIPIFIFQTMLNIGLMFWSSLITFKIPDFKLLIPYLGRLWFYASGVFFSVEQAVSSPLLKTILHYNPANIFLTMYRDVMVYSRVPSSEYWWLLGIWSIVVLFFGLLVFWLNELSFGKVK